MTAAGEGKGGFGAGLTGAAQAILADARTALAAKSRPDAETVHDLRKALKRWRALMRLLNLPLGESARQMRAEARDLMRALAGARDAQSALDAVLDASKAQTALSPTSLDTIRRRLTSMRDAAQAEGFTGELRGRLDRYLDSCALALERWPLDAIEPDAVIDGLTLTYRRARQRVPENWDEADPEHLHDLRRRVVEHRHQMDLIEHLWPRLGKVWAEETQRLRNRLGACQDLAVLAMLTAPHGPLAPWRSRLAPVIAERRAAHLKAAARLAGRLFAEKPKAFRKRIAALWSARRQRH